MNKISVIIPVYNVEEFLPQCLDSVINQTYTNLEIILVNDGSTDSCGKICDDYASRDRRIQVIHKKNGGLSDARNAGLQLITGDFISFVDSDDLLSLNFYKILSETAAKWEADIVECNFQKFEILNNISDKSSVKDIEVQIYGTQKALKLLMNEFFKQVVWNKIYKKELLTQITFPLNRINEDEFWTYKAFGNSSKIAKISSKLYFYRQQPESIMGKRYSLKRLDGLDALDERIVYMETNFPSLKNLAVKKFCFAAMWHYRMISEHPEIDQQKVGRKNIVKRVKKYGKSEVYNNWEPKEIFWFRLFLLSPNICVKLQRRNDLRVEKLNLSRNK